MVVSQFRSKAARMRAVAKVRLAGAGHSVEKVTGCCVCLQVLNDVRLAVYAHLRPLKKVHSLQD